MSFGGLHIGRTGLAASQRALETAGHNIANANTPGYTRQRVELAANDAIHDHRGLLGPPSSGQGVGITSVTRSADALVETNFRQAVTGSGSWGTRADFFERAEQVLGPLDQGVSQNITTFWNTWEALSQAPESITSRNQVLNAANELVQSINDAHTRVLDVQEDLAFDMRATVDRVNQLAEEIAGLNGQIAAASTGGSSPNDLLDRRAEALREISELTGAQISTNSHGHTRVALDNLPLVDGVVSDSLSVAGTPETVVWDLTGDPVGMTGELGALVELSGPVTSDILADLDLIATELRDVVNTAHRTGFGLDGVDGRDFFTGVDASDLAIDPALTNTMLAASASGAAPDGNHALVMGALRTAIGGSASTVGDLVAALQGKLGLESNHARRQSELADVVVADVGRLAAETSGVSLDEEFTDMLKYQRAYQASARVITVMDQMLDKLINGTGITR